MASAHPNTVGGSMHLYSSINTEKKEKKKKNKRITVRVLKGFREEGKVNDFYTTNLIEAMEY